MSSYPARSVPAAQLVVFTYNDSTAGRLLVMVSTQVIYSACREADKNVKDLSYLSPSAWDGAFSGKAGSICLVLTRPHEPIGKSVQLLSFNLVTQYVVLASQVIH
jgi:hypothetical protein